MTQAKPLQLRMRGVCSSGKYAYSSEAMALDWIAKINGHSNRCKPLTYAYNCKECGGWHHTSRRTEWKP